MSLVDRIVSRQKRIDYRSHSADLPLDHQVTFCQGADEWRYDAEGDQILLNGEAVEEGLEFEKRAVREWSAISAGLTDYKEFVAVRSPYFFPRFARRIDSIQDTILGMMKRVYDEKVNGLTFKWIEGVPFLNNVNVTALMVLFQFHPTPKARRFLEGLRGRLAAFLRYRRSIPLDKAGSVVHDLIGEVDSLLDRTPAHYPRLSPDPAHRPD